MPISILPAVIICIEAALVAAVIVIIRALTRRPAPRGRHHAPAGARAYQPGWLTRYDEADQVMGLCGWINDDGEHCHYPAGHEMPHQQRVQFHAAF